MSLSHLPNLLTTTFADFAWWLDRRLRQRLNLIFLGMLLARGRRTCTSWFRPAGITDKFRPAYTTINAVGRTINSMAVTTLSTVEPLLNTRRLTVAIDDTPTPRYGPEVEGCGIHHNPTPGPTGQEFLYGHAWVTIAAIVRHPQWDTIALPLQAQLYIRKADIEKLPPERNRPFQTKLELAVEQLKWLKSWVEDRFEERWVFVDGGYSNKTFLSPAQSEGWVVVGRLRKDAALWSLPKPKRPGQRGPAPTYGKERVSLAMRAGHKSGWEQVECVQYGNRVTKKIKTFEATWRPAGRRIRVVLIQEEHGWVAFFCTKVDATVVEILESAADRGAIEQTFHDVKEVWGAGQQQVRNIHSNEACFNMNLWMYSVVEVWAWNQAEECLSDRSASPWDSEPRRPSHNDKRKSLQREVLQGEIEEGLSGRPTKERIRALAERLLELAA
ncbi:MAG: transposase [Planctomycetes bacterium]|nr:transposase [Planctomycetota bacterium]